LAPANRNVAGRKSDVKDADWASDLLAHGLIRPSFVPDSQTQKLPTLLGTRKQLGREKVSHVQRIQKTLEDANIKLDSVISGLKRSGDDRGNDRGRKRSRRTGAPCQSPGEGFPRDFARGAARPRDQAPPLPPRPPSATDQSPKLTVRWRPASRPFAPPSNK
jgi:hypothetical protein